MDTDVLVVGAGPTGLMLAGQLARRGVRTMIVDRHGGPATQTRAIGVQARTLELYAHLGVVDRALELGRRGTGANVWARGRRMAHFPLGEAGRGLTRYPYVFLLGQDDNERILGERLRDFGASVQWSTELVALRQDERQATATLRLPDGSTRELAASWVAGCDGAHSAVRELSGIAFPGAPYEHVFFVADTVATGDMVEGEVNVFLWRSGFHLFFPMRGENHWRVIGILPAALRGREGVTFDDVIPSLTHEAGSTLAFRSCSWFSTYRIHHRAAARFRDRRAFLAGDAAHIHSPVGAQGMNTGLQDAYNLAWKLALVASGRADAALLDTYEEERVPVARRLLATTDEAFRIVVSDGALAGLLRTEVMARIAAFALRRERFQRFAFRLVSQIGIRYRASPLAENLPGLPASAPRAGDRFPWMVLALRRDGEPEDLLDALDDLRFHLIVVGQRAPDAAELRAGDLVRIHEVPGGSANDAALARAGIPKPAFYVVRPDGHVGLCGARVDAAAIARHLAGRVRLRP